MTFECTNNVAEYEALLLGLHTLKDLGAKQVQVFGDSELVINQVNDSYQTKHPRMRAYRNEVWDMFGNYFIEHSVKVIPRYDNTVVDSLAIAARKFKTPTAGKRKYKVDIVNRSSIPDNTKCNVPDPPTGEEDATIHQIIRASSPMNMKHTYI